MLVPCGPYVVTRGKAVKGVPSACEKWLWLRRLNAASIGDLSMMEEMLPPGDVISTCATGLGVGRFRAVLHRRKRARVRSCRLNCVTMVL